MPYQEKSAWVMSLALSAAALFYVWLVMSLSSELGSLAPPVVPLLVKFTVVLVALAILGHIAAAIFAPKEADAPLDEREQMIVTRAGHISGYLFGFGVVTSLIAYLVVYDGDVLFYGVFASLVFSQLAEYATRIFLFRRGV